MNNDGLELLLQEYYTYLKDANELVGTTCQSQVVTRCGESPR